jgi:hypothetical protein
MSRKMPTPGSSSNKARQDRTLVNLSLDMSSRLGYLAFSGTDGVTPKISYRGYSVCPFNGPALVVEENRKEFRSTGFFRKLL